MEPLETAGKTRAALETETNLEVWLSAWPEMRIELESLLARYLQIQPDYDPHWLEWVIAEMNDAVMNMEHRAAWLRRHIAEPPTDR
ncbi:MAG: hypothetical protein RLZZ387_4320 [Chloroflexota bacterium]